MGKSTISDLLHRSSVRTLRLLYPGEDGPIAMAHSGVMAGFPSTPRIPEATSAFNIADE